MSIETKNKLVVFQVDEQQFAMHLSAVERILPVMEIHPLPLAPEYVLGTINFQGEFLPVVNLRKLFLIPQREMDLNDQLIITTSSNTRVALWTDSVMEIVDRAEEEISKTNKILLDVGYVEGLFKLNDGMVLIHDLEKFLTPEETSKLLKALEEQHKTKDEGRGKREEGRGKKEDVETRHASSEGRGTRNAKPRNKKQETRNKKQKG
ncbi:MAG: purine-binding chemotaxis protein CheW [Bacteroidales bacterium]|nr:purine-binding chemotaxis protein CheW [Bacteroidales bacterium]